jgi:hypothetical protein
MRFEVYNYNNGNGDARWDVSVHYEPNLSIAMPKKSILDVVEWFHGYGRDLTDEDVKTLQAQGWIRIFK